MLKRCLKRLLAAVLACILLIGIPQGAEAATVLTSSDELIDVLKTMEGFAKKPYWDVNHWAIGYGTRCPDDKLDEYKEEGISKSAAVKLLRAELKSKEDAVNEFATTYKLKFKQHQFDALVSFSYNCGTGWMSETDGYFNEAVREKDKSNAFLYGICLWSSAGGEYILLDRRLCEANMYINGVYKASNSGDKDLYPDNFRWVFLDGNGGEPEYQICAFDSENPIKLKVSMDTVPTGKDKNGKKFKYTLAGWYTESGKKVSKLNDSLDAGTVLYAKWKDPEGNIVELPKGEKPEMERVVVTGSTVNVRSGPGTFYDKVDTVSEGTILTLTEVYEGNGYVWGKFSKGWLSLSYTNYKDAPVITKQPKSTNVTKGSKAKVSVEATGKDLTYQWYYKDAGAGEFKKSSANTASYSLTMNESRTGRKVYCMITDGYGNTVKTKTVTLGMAVSIAKQPKKASAAEGEKAKVRVTATGDGLTYRWYYKDAGSSKFKESGANTATYSLTMNESRAGRQVYCKITDEYGNTVKSKTVTLGMAVSITKQPKNASADEGKKVKLSVSATGDGLTYQWYYKSKNSSKFKKSSGTGKATYSITMNEGRNDRQMYCVITDAYGNSVKTKTVTIGLNARITKQPKSAQAQDGEKVKVSVSATGVGLSYRWYYKDAGAGKFKKSGANTATYSLTMNESCAGRQVYCVITDLYGNSVKTKTVTLGMAVSISKQPKSVQVAKGKTAKVTVSATGDGLTYKWYVKNQGESKYTRDKSVKGKTYSVKMSSKVSGRLVYCKITDAYGNTVKAKTVTLKMK